MMKKLIVIVCLLIASPSLAQSPAPEKTILYSDITLFDGTGATEPSPI